jgi:hypothetical protein
MDITLSQPQRSGSKEGAISDLSQFRGPEPGGGSLNYDIPIFAVPYMLLEAGVTEVFTYGGMKGEDAYANAQLAVFLFALRSGSVGGKTGEVVKGGNLTEELVKVRHHTSLSGLKGIKNSSSINASRGIPYGVDVEVGPFVKATKAKFGQAGTGSYIEFSVPKSLVGPPAPGYMGGPGTAGRIVTNGAPFELTGTAPKFVRWNWLGF